MYLFFADNMWLIWAAIALLCLLLELSSGDFYITCFAVGAVVAAVVSVIPWTLWLQIFVFAIVSLLSILLLRPRIVAALHKGGEERVSNADALIGRVGKVTEAIPERGYGRVQIDGDYWKAESTDGAPIGEGIKVRIVSRESVIVTVEPSE